MKLNVKAIGLAAGILWRRTRDHRIASYDGLLRKMPLTMVGLRGLGRNRDNAGAYAVQAVVAGNTLAFLACLPMALPLGPATGADSASAARRVHGRSPQGHVWSIGHAAHVGAGNWYTVPGSGKYAIERPTSESASACAVAP